MFTILDYSSALEYSIIRRYTNIVYYYYFGTRWMTDLINNIVKEGCIPDDWRKSILVPMYKGKGDPLVCVCHTELLSY